MQLVFPILIRWIVIYPVDSTIRPLNNRGLNVRIVAYSSFLLNYHFKIRKECFIKLASVVQRLDSAIHRINLYPVDSAISFPNTYPLDSDLSGG